MTEILHERVPGGPDVVGYRLPGRTVAAGILTGAGAAREPAGGTGASHVLSQAVFQRTRRRSRHDLEFALEESGLQKDCAVNPEWTRYWVRGLSEDLPHALALLAECVLAPALDRREVDAALRLRDEHGGRAVAVSVLPARPPDHMLLRVLAMGMDELHLVCDAGLQGL